MNIPHPARKAPGEQAFAVAVLLWLVIAGVCVMLANAWAMGY